MSRSKRVPTNTYPDLVAWRTAQEWNQRTAAAYLGISQGYYSKLELRTTIAYGKRAKRIVQKTGVPLEIIVGAA